MLASVVESVSGMKFDYFMRRFIFSPLGMDCTFVIGPEGGLTEDEIEYLQSLNFTCVSLGKRILRAETAGLYAVMAMRMAIG